MLVKLAWSSVNWLSCRTSWLVHTACKRHLPSTGLHLYDSVTFCIASVTLKFYISNTQFSNISRWKLLQRE